VVRGMDAGEGAYWEELDRLVCVGGGWLFVRRGCAVCFRVLLEAHDCDVELRLDWEVFGLSVIDVVSTTARSDISLYNLLISTMQR